MVLKDENDVQQPRRGPGRPRKVPKEEDVIGVTGKIITAAPKATGSSTGLPRKRGRPPKKAVAETDLLGLAETDHDFIDALRNGLTSTQPKKNLSYKEEYKKLDEFEIASMSLTLGTTTPIAKKRGRPRKQDVTPKKSTSQTTIEGSAPKRGPGRPKKVQS
ncbi:hypothetical protein CLU79DRAFT_731474 [Phycomyces nitens]|nr:hypothetical protein CLU79DRAFT_731474 [Phycomyces nitens]